MSALPIEMIVMLKSCKRQEKHLHDDLPNSLLKNDFCLKLFSGSNV
jgi:hypothetical protein